MTSRRQSVRPTLETLEDRVVPTTTLYLDFGEGFGGGLNLRADQLRDTVNGPNLIGRGAVYAGGSVTPVVPAITAATNLRFTSLASVVANQRLNFNGTGGAGDTADYVALRNSIEQIVRRQYEPFDVNIVVSSARNLTDVRTILGRNAGSTTGQADAYVFVAGIVRTDQNLILGDNASFFGIAPLGDLTARRNTLDESVIVCADTFLGSTVNGVQIPFDVALANVIAHEAGHTFGLVHTNAVFNTAVGLVTDSDLMVEGGGSGLDLTNIGFFSRLNLMEGNGNTNTGRTRNAYTQLVNDPDIGRRAGSPEFVTGSGAFDKITITRLNNTQATVVVDIYREASFTNRIGYATYTISTANGILVEAGFREDRISIDARIGKLVTVRGGAGTDTVEMITPTGITSATVTAGRIRAGNTVINVTETEELSVAGNGSTIVNVDGASATASQWITLTAGAVTGLLPQKVNFRSVGSVAMTAGKYGNIVDVFDTTVGASMTLFTGTGKDEVTVLQTSSGLTLAGQNGFDEVTLGRAALRDRRTGIVLRSGVAPVINGNLTIENLSAFTAVTVEDGAALSSRYLHLWTEGGYHKMTGLGAGYVVYKAADTASLDFQGGDFGYTFVIDQAALHTSIRTGSGWDELFVYGTPGELRIDAGAGLNEVSMGFFSLSGIQGAVDLRATGGSTSYRFTDLAEAVGGEQYHLSATQFYRTDAAGGSRTGTITFQDVFDLDIYGGRADNSYFVTDTPVVGSYLGATQSVDLYTFDGADYVSVSGSTGALRVHAGTGDDIVVGHGYVAEIFGEEGRDLLIAGGAATLLSGDAGEDIVVGGQTTLDDDRAGLEAVQAEWGRTDLVYADRVQNLLFGGGLNGATLLALAGSASGGNSLQGGDDLDLYFGSQSLDVHDWDPNLGEVFVGEAIQVDARALSGASLTLDYVARDPGNPFAVTLLPGTHWVAGANGAPVYFTVGDDGTLDYAPELDGIFSGRGTTSLTIHGVAVEIDARNLGGASLYVDYTAYDPAAPQTLTLLPGQHWFNLVGGEVVYFTVAADGTIDYVPELDNFLSGRGTSSLAVHGVAVELDARNLGGASLVLDYGEYDPTAPVAVNLLPGQHWFNLAGGEVVYFIVNLDGTIGYDAAYEGALTGSGTSQLSINGLAVQIDAVALGATEFTLDYVTHDATTPAAVQLLPGQHWLYVPGGDLWYFTVNLDGTLDYAPELDGILSGRGLSELVVLAQ